MLDSELLFFLKAYLGKPTVDFKLSDEENVKIFTYLNEHCKEDCLQNPQNQLKIKQAFKDYFEAVGYILFKIKEGKILLKVLAYKIEPKDSVNLPDILKILSQNEDLIEYDYNGNQNQISIPKELKDKLYDFIGKIKNEEINKKELIRFAVNEFLELHSRDIVIVKDDQIFIKILDDKYKRDITEEDKGTIAGRYNGINEEELKSLYDDFFSKKENKNFFYNVADMFIQIHMLERKIDNETYEKKIFSIIQSIIYEQLSNSYNDDEEFCMGFSGYIFRTHFEEVFMHIANFMLAELAIANQHIIDFIKYYSLNVVVVDGRKYKVPALETDDNLRWNTVSILSIVKIYVKTKTSVETLKKNIEELDKKIKTLHIDNYSPLEYQNLLDKEKRDIEQNLSHERERLEKLIDEVNISNNKHKKPILEQEILKTRVNMKKMSDERAHIIEETVQKGTIIEYNNTKRALDSVVIRLRRDERILEQNKKAYLSIKHTLTKALISKKTLIS